MSRRNILVKDWEMIMLKGKIAEHNTTKKWSHKSPTTDRNWSTDLSWKKCTLLIDNLRTAIPKICESINRGLRSKTKQSAAAGHLPKEPNMNGLTKTSHGQKACGVSVKNNKLSSTCSPCTQVLWSGVPNNTQQTPVMQQDWKNSHEKTKTQGGHRLHYKISLEILWSTPSSLGTEGGFQHNKRMQCHRWKIATLQIFKTLILHSFIHLQKQAINHDAKDKDNIDKETKVQGDVRCIKRKKSWTDSCHPHQTRKWSWRGKDWKRQAACEWSADEEFMKLTVSHQELEEVGKLKVLKQLLGKVLNVKFNDVVTIVRCRKTGRGAGVLSCTQEETRRKVERIALIKEDRKKRKMQEWFVQSGEKQEVSFEWFVLQLDPMKENSSLWPPDVQILHEKIN